MASNVSKCKEIDRYPRGTPRPIGCTQGKNLVARYRRGSRKNHIALDFPQGESMVHARESEWQHLFRNAYEKPLLDQIDKREDDLNHHENGSNDNSQDLDLSLSLAPIGIKRSMNAPELPVAVSSYSLRVMELHPMIDTEVATHQHEPKLICMGCRGCYIYVMVSEADPKCPRCHKSEFLIDPFLGNQKRSVTKRPRMK